MIREQYFVAAAESKRIGDYVHRRRCILDERQIRRGGPQELCKRLPRREPRRLELTDEEIHRLVGEPLTPMLLTLKHESRRGAKRSMVEIDRVRPDRPFFAPLPPIVVVSDSQCHFLSISRDTCLQCAELSASCIIPNLHSLYTRGMDGRLPENLPVAGVLREAVAASRTGAVVVTAPPGSGKTMLVPAAILDDLSRGQKLVLIQPRRLAARAVARRIAQLRGGRLGDEVGYQVRFDSRVGRDTRLIVATTGILLRRLLDDISLEDLGAVVLDEFHERTIEMDLVLGALVRIRQTLRPDLRIVIMSATLAAEPVARLLGGCPIVHAEGRPFPVQIRYQRRGEKHRLEDLVANQLPHALRETSGHVLVFLPGVGEIFRCQKLLSGMVDREGHALLPLFGDLPAEKQDDVLNDIGRRKIILATNVAETSLTIDGVTAVIDSGQARQLRVAASTGLPRLELVPISQASADQRAGRAGRTAPGICWRLWDESSHRGRPTVDTPEILRSDLAEPLLQLLALGERDDFPWLDPPPPDSVDNALRILTLLGAIDDRQRITELGKELAVLPAHPRLGRLLLAGAERGVLRETSVAAALLSERDPFRAAEHVRPGPRVYGQVRSRSDVVDRVLALQAFHAGGAVHDTALEIHPGGAQNVLRAADQLYHLTDVPRAARAERPDLALMHALLDAFPDRLARLRSGAQDRALLVGGRGVRIDASSRVRGERLFLAIDINDAAGEVAGPAGIGRRARLARRRSALSP